MNRAFPLSITGRRAAQDFLAAWFLSQGLRVQRVEHLTRGMLRAYMEARHEDEVMQRPWSQTSWEIAALEVGQHKDFYGRSLQLLRQRFPSARKLMQNPDANFRCKSISMGGVRVFRMPDGIVNWRDPLENPKVLELVSMEVGEVKQAATIKSTRGAGALGSNSKVMARRHLNNHRAQWAVFRSGTHIMLKRTA